MNLPGIDLPVEQGSTLPFAGRRSNWQEFIHPITVRERVMIALMTTIKDKPDWEIKVFDDAIVDEWMSEAMKEPEDLPVQDQTSETNNTNDELDWQPEVGDETIHFNAPARQRVVTDNVFRYCIDELRDQAADAAAKGFTEALEANATVYVSDTAIKRETKLALQSSVVSLAEAMSEKPENWNPGSDGKVLHVVNPSLFPLMYGVSRYLTEGMVPLQGCSEYIGRGELVPPMDYMSSEHPFDYSAHHQWLPCEVSLDASDRAKITSYINGLHPDEDKAVYAAIEEVISKSIPMWKLAVRSTLYRHEAMRLEPHYEHDFSTNGTEELVRQSRNQDRYEESDDGSDTEAQQDEAEDDDYDSVADYDSLHRNHYNSVDRNPEGIHWLPEQYMRSQYEEVLEPESYGPRTRSAEGANAANFEWTFERNNLQIIVRLTNVHMTPEKPTFNGDPWRVEGLPNEHICATAIYYYDSSNVTNPHVSFREYVNNGNLGFMYNRHHDALVERYGIDALGPGSNLQVLGKVSTPEDRLLVYPNVLHRRVLPFELVDATKPGHQKMLTLFLVDPNIRIPSTAIIPPQQQHWWARLAGIDHAFKKLPQELADHVLDEVDFPLSMEQARQMRDELIEDRQAQLRAIDYPLVVDHSGML